MDRAFAAVAIGSELDTSREAASSIRLHGIVASPVSPLAVAVGRRPGHFAMAFDLGRGGVLAEFQPGAGRVFSGHGRFTPDGKLFLTNELERASGVPARGTMGRGVLAVRDVGAGFPILAEWSTHGDGPHDLMHWDTAIIVANGGIEPHTPEARDAEVAGSNILLLDAATGKPRIEARVSADLTSLSLRHLAMHETGGMVVAAQDLLSDGVARPLLFAIRDDGRLTGFDVPGNELRQLRGYIGSVAFDRSGAFIAAASPRGGRIAVWRSNGRYVGSVPLVDGCGLAETPEPGCFVATSGYGEVIIVTADADGVGIAGRHGGGPRFDNHMASVG
jgi:hypothetical protein